MTPAHTKKNGNKSRYNNIHQFSYMHARYVLHYRCGYVIRTCLKPVLNIIFYHVEFYTLMCRKCVKKKREFLQCRYNTYTHMYKLSVRLSIKPSRLIYKHGVQVVISQCVCSSSFLNQHLKNFSTMKKIFLSEVLGGRVNSAVCFCGSFSPCWPVLFQWSRWMVFLLCQFFPLLLSSLDWYLWTKLSCTPE